MKHAMLMPLKRKKVKSLAWAKDQLARVTRQLDATEIRSDVVYVDGVKKSMTPTEHTRKAGTYLGLSFLLRRS